MGAQLLVMFCCDVCFVCSLLGVTTAMVKAYLRYEFAGAFGVVSSGCSPEFDASGKQLFTASLENVSVWNVKQASLVRHSLTPRLP